MGYKYICRICGVIFDEPHFIRERQYHSEVDCYEDGGRYVCPVCGEDSFERFTGNEDGEDDEV